MKKYVMLYFSMVFVSLWADFTLEYQMDGDVKQIVQYKDAAHVKIITRSTQGKDESTQMIVDGKKYMVISVNGKKQYMDMDSMMSQMQQMSSMFPSEPEEEMETPQFKIIHKGERKNISGINAQLWRMESEYEGQKEFMDIWVTDDKDIVDAVEKYAKAMQTFMQMEGGENALSNFLTIEPGYATLSFEGMKLVRYDNTSIPESVYALPAGVGKKKKDDSSVVKKLPLCPLTGKQGEAKSLKKILKSEANGWKLIENGVCMDMMKMSVENAIYQKGKSYIHISLSVNVEGEKGMIATYKLRNMKVSHLQRGKIGGYRYQTGFWEMVGQHVMDVKLPNAMLSLTATKNVKEGLPSFAKNALDLSQFVAVKRSKPNAEDALKGLFGGNGGSNAGMPSEADMQKASEMLKSMFGK